MLYAIWEIISSNEVYFVFNNGQEDLVQTIPLADPITIQNPIREGYEFVGWTTEVNETTPIILGEINRTPAIITLYAIWSLSNVKYTLNIEPNNGKALISNQPGFNEAIILPITLSKKGYILEGFYLDPGFLEPSTYEVMSNENLRLYVKRVIDDSLFAENTLYFDIHLFDGTLYQLDLICDRVVQFAVLTW